MHRLTVALLLVCASALAAQVPTVPTGAWLRITGRSTRPADGAEVRYYGHFQTIDQDSLITMSPQGEKRTAIALTDLRRLELSRGVHHHPFRAMWIGAGLSVVVGGLAGAISPDSGLSRVAGAGRGAAIVVPLGMGLGFAYGLLYHPYETWRTVRLDVVRRSTELDRP